MDTQKRAGRTAGALFLLSNVTFIIGAIILVEPLLGAPDYLSALAASRSQVVLGMLLELINSFAYLGIAAIMFSALRFRFEAMALGYFGLRAIEFVTQILADIGALQLLSLSEEFVGAGSPASSAFQALGATLVSERAWSFQMLNMVFCVSALVLYSMLYRTRLVPTFISVWGLVGATLVLVTTLLDLFGVGVGSAVAMVTGLPMLLNELFLGVWLIVKGFATSGRAAELGRAEGRGA